MPRQDLILLMKTKGAPFDDQVLAMMTDSECWKWLYSTGALKSGETRRQPSVVPEICFTGFQAADVERLSTAAGDRFAIKDSVTKNLKILVTGAAAGPKKVEKAKSQGCQILTEKEFLDLV